VVAAAGGKFIYSFDCIYYKRLLYHCYCYCQPKPSGPNWLLVELRYGRNHPDLIPRWSEL
jgi:hypothetical protein